MKIFLCITKFHLILFFAVLTLSSSAQQPFKLLFSSPEDIVNTWGKLHFSTSSAEWINRNAAESPMNSNRMNPTRWPVACFPQADGSWVVYSQAYESTGGGSSWHEKTSNWSLMRGVTMDGVTFTNVETVISNITGTWTDHVSIAYNPDADEYMMLKIKNDNLGHGYYAFFSKYGKNWQEHTANPLFYEGDAMSVFWSPVLKKFVVVSKSYQQWTKMFIDHAPNSRQALIIRSSQDGRTWTPSESLPSSGGNPPGSSAWHSNDLYTVPDTIDSLDLEFRSGTAFWYHDRAYMMVLNYAASPMFPNAQGQELDNEWWTSLDGLKWERPSREENALGIFMEGKKQITMPPLIIGGKLQWQFGWNEENNVVIGGITEDRISGVSAAANGEFSTKPFKMPNGELFLNATLPSLDRPWARRNPQPYVMVEVLNESGSVISGFERSNCVIWDGTTSPNRNTQVDVTKRNLSWKGKSAKSLTGQTISLRFYFGGSTIYGVTTNALLTAIDNIYDKQHPLIGIYPNPTVDMIYFKNLQENSRVLLVDMLGRIVLEKDASELSAGLSSQPYANGLYVIKVMQGREIIQSEKILKY